MSDANRQNLENTESAAMSITIAATFVAEPVETPLRFWMQELGISTKVTFAPYDQVFQQLLDPASLLATNQNGVNVVLVRVEDWQGDVSQSHATPNGSPDPRAGIERNVRDFIHALATRAERSSSTYLICLCPGSTSNSATPQQRSLFMAMENLIASEISGINGVEVITVSDLTATYPVADVYDHHTDKLARIPYTPVFFTALGTMIARKLYALKSPPYKVIVLDCDGTLWSGVCGEDGCDGIQINAARKALQKFVVQQHDRGMLICLCSKNNEEDVLEVFASRSDMILRRDHITACQINWKLKSKNIQFLARELGIGLDSFILIDDDPLECAEVREHCPEVLTLQLPSDSESIPGFLKHVWAWDHRKITEEDRQRVVLYRSHIIREQVRRDSPTLKEFLTSLHLELSISPLTLAESTRVSELTFRTNQFNLTTRRRTEAELRQFCEPGRTECLVVRVKDRFGDYGLVGTILFEVNADSLTVDTFLLSCRALGRGVEHEMLARLGEIAKQRGLSHIALHCVPSNKNRPALDFLEGLSEGVRESWDNGFVVRIAAENAASACYSRETRSSDDNTLTAAGSSLYASVSASTPDTRKRTALLSSIPETLYRPEVIHKRISQNRVRSESNTVLVPPRTPIEKTLVDIFSELLGIKEIGIHDSFFDLGGHSLMAMQALSRVREAFEIELSVTLFFTTNFTAAELADAVLKEQIKQSGPENVAMALKRLSNLTDDEAQTLLGDPASRFQRSKPI
jgi:FkbH-like protein